jgi:hypothetical protein
VGGEIDESEWIDFCNSLLDFLDSLEYKREDTALTMGASDGA